MLPVETYPNVTNPAIPAVVPALSQSGEPPSQQGSVCSVREPSFYEQEFKPRLCLPTSAEGWNQANAHFEQGLVPRVIQLGTSSGKHAAIGGGRVYLLCN